MSDLGALLRGDVAEAVLRSLLRDLTQQVRRNGGSVPQWAEPVLRGLRAAAGTQDVPELRLVAGSAGGTTVGSVGDLGDDSWVPIAEAAVLVNRSQGYVRRLAREGRVLRLRVGTNWLVDPASLRAVVGRAS